MATATFSKVNDAIESAMNVGAMATDSFLMVFSNTAPASETSNPLNDNNGVLANVTQISYTNWTDSLTVDRTLEGVTSTQTSGTYTFDCNDWTITASGGAIAAWRYPYLVDDTPTSPLDPLMGNWDYGSALTLNDGDTANININASGLFTIA